MNKNVLFVGNFLSATNGTRSVCEDLSDRLEMLGWRVTRTSRQMGRLRRLLDMVWIVFACRRDYACAAVEVYSGNAFIWAEVVCRLLSLLRKPYILSLHGGSLPDFARRKKGRVGKLLTGAAAVTTPSRFLKQELADLRRDILYLPNALPVANYPFRQRDKLIPNLAWLRSFHSIYNPLLAVQTIELLRNDFPDIHLTMYGPDKGDGSLQKVKNYIRERGMEDMINIPGAIPKKQVPEFLAHHDIFLNTTRLESFGVCVIEAAACGLPVVTTAVGELTYLWSESEEVLLVPEGNAEAMATAVRCFLTEPKMAARLSNNARKKAEQFDWSIILPKWEKLFQDICESPQ